MAVVGVGDRATAWSGWNYVVLLVVAAAVIFSALMVVYAKYQTRVLFAELQELQQVRDTMEEEWGMLQLEQSTWATHGRVEDTARKRLQMELPAPEKVVVIGQ